MGEHADVLRPQSVAEAATMLAGCAAAARPVRPAGAGTRRGWGGAGEPTALDLSTTGLCRVIEHNPGDFTAVVEAGTPLAAAQRAFAEAGQWLAIDPPPPDGTVGGLVATADSGPSRHRYGGVRDLLIGITVVLADGTIASSGGRVIKNVAGYDLGKLFTGSFGTLGLIASLAFRLHPIPARTATVRGGTADAQLLGRVALELARAPLEAHCLDYWWRDGAGGVLVRFGGVAAGDQAERARALLRGLDTEVSDDDDEVWAGQRERQRRRDGAVLKVSGRASDLPAVVAAARAQRASAVGRAALGLSWLSFGPSADLAARVAAARTALAPRACTVLDGAELIADPWPAPPPSTITLMRRVKAQFDPAHILRPGAFVGGI